MPGMRGDKKKRPWWHWSLLSAGTCAFIVLLVWGPWWIEGHHLKDSKGELVSSAGIIVTGFRTMLVAIAAGGFTAAGLWYTHKKHELEADSQVTERYVEAVKLLGSENLHERLGGIYSLERIMKDSERDHPTIVEVLSAFTRTKLAEEAGRHHAALRRLSGRSVRTVPQPPRLRFLSEDIKAALAVLDRQPTRRYMQKGFDLTGAELQFCEAPIALSLKVAQLSKANFAGSTFRGANLEHAWLNYADLTRSDFTEACFEHAFLVGADLTDAELEGAFLWGAQLAGAVLKGTNLKNTHWSYRYSSEDIWSDEVVDRAVQTLCQAHLYESTTLPAPVASNRLVLARIAECEAADRPDGNAASSAPPAGQ